MIDPSALDLSLWRPSERWTRRGVNFLVEVVHLTRSFAGTDEFPFDGGQRWCVYAYIYPEHPHFEAFDETGDLWQEATQDMPLHEGCSFLHGHYTPSGKVLSYQVGADYNHLHDDRFTRMRTPAEAAEVFADAEELFTWLTKRAEPLE